MLKLKIVRVLPRRSTLLQKQEAKQFFLMGWKQIITKSSLNQGEKHRSTLPGVLSMRKKN